MTAAAPMHRRVTLQPFGEMARMPDPDRSQAQARRQKRLEYRLLFVVSFVIFLVAGLVSRALPDPWRPRPPGPPSGKSVLGEAKAAATIFVPFAFMG